MKNKPIYLGIFSAIFFVIHMCLYYNYDFGINQGFSYSHDRDIFIQYAMFNIEFGIVINESLSNQGYPYSAETLVIGDWTYPKGFVVLLTTISLLLSVSPLHSIIVAGITFAILGILVIFCITNLTFNSKKVSLLSVIFALIIPTTGEIHGPITPLPSTLATILLLVCFLVIKWSSDKNIVPSLIICFILGISISQTHRPTTTLAFLVSIVWLITVNRVSSLFFISGLYAGFIINFATFRTSDIWSLLRIPDAIEITSLVVFLIFILSYTYLHHSYLNRFHYPELSEQLTRLFLAVYSPVLILSLSLMILLAIGTDISLSEVGEITNLNFTLPLIIVGGLFLPAMIYGILSRKTDHSAFSFFLLLITLIGLYHPDRTALGISRFVAYGLAFSVIYQARFLYVFFDFQKIFKSFVLVSYILGMFIICMLEIYAPFNLQFHDSGISDKNALESQFYLEDKMYTSNSTQTIIGSSKILNKITARIGTSDVDYYIDRTYPDKNYMMDRNVANFSIVRKYHFLNLNEVSYDYGDKPVSEFNLNPHNFAGGSTHYYSKIYESNDIMIYQKF